MVCTCGKQMTQYKNIGDGIMRDDYYETWEIKHCTYCKRFVKEQYIAKTITSSQVRLYVKKLNDAGFTDLIYRGKRVGLQNFYKFTWKKAKLGKKNLKNG